MVFGAKGKTKRGIKQPLSKFATLPDTMHYKIFSLIIVNVRFQKSLEVSLAQL